MCRCTANSAAPRQMLHLGLQVLTFSLKPKTSQQVVRLRHAVNRKTRGSWPASTIQSLSQTHQTLCRALNAKQRLCPLCTTDGAQTSERVKWPLNTHPCRSRDMCWSWSEDSTLLNRRIPLRIRVLLRFPSELRSSWEKVKHIHICVHIYTDICINTVKTFNGAQKYPSVGFGALCNRDFGLKTGSWL